MVGERQGNGMGTAWERHGMCESAFTVLWEGQTLGVGASSGTERGICSCLVKVINVRN
jgi:hypothetical protein